MKHQPFAIWLLALVAGILFENHIEFSQNFLVCILFISFFLMLIVHFLKQQQWVLTLLLLVFLCSVGALRFSQKNDIIKQLPLLEKNSQIIQFKVDKILKPSEKYIKYLAKISAIKNDSLHHQKVLVYVKKSQTNVLVKEQFWSYGRLQKIQSPKNPYQFNYQNYMENKGVFIYCFLDTIVNVESPPIFSLQHKLSSFKSRIKKQLINKGFSKEAQIFISALALGDRTDFDKNIQEKLSSAGVMHLFAISGLHVGIVFSLFMLIFYPLLFLPNGKALRILMSLSFIWLFAWFVAFTPSITRAVFMISFYYATLLLKRPTDIFHTLAFTALVVLIISPNQLFDVGFQLSYSAVFFIAWLYPITRKFFPHFRKPWKNYFFNLLSITVVAQMGVLPFSIFYFHKFSGLFLVGNLLILPFAGCLVVISFIVIILLGLNIFPLFLIETINVLFQKVIGLITWITQFDSFIFKDISLNKTQLIIALAFLIWMKFVLQKFKWKKLIPALAIILIFQLSRIYNQENFGTKSELIVFNQYKGSVIGIRNAFEMNVFWQVEDSLKTLEYTIKPYLIHEQIKNVKFHSLFANDSTAYFIKKNGLIKFNNQTFYIVNNKQDSLPTTDYLILRKGKFAYKPIFSKTTKKVITDASNYPSVIRRLKEFSDKIYVTSQDGAFVFNRKNE